MQTIKVIIKNEKKTQKYEYTGSLNIPVTTLLERINHENNIHIHYSSSCLQGLCGSCAMLINGWPKLACKTFVNQEAMTKYYKKITLEPLSKFPTVKDLKVDRSIMHRNLINTTQWIETKAKINMENISFEYELSQCLMCGCCLEACPNYNGDDEYYGMPLTVSSAKIIKQETDDDRINKLRSQYKKHFYKNCVKALVCEDVCPMKIPTQRAISMMNKQAIWNFRHILKKK